MAAIARSIGMARAVWRTPDRVWREAAIGSAGAESMFLASDRWDGDLLRDVEKQKDGVYAPGEPDEGESSADGDVCMPYVERIQAIVGYWVAFLASQSRRSRSDGKPHVPSHLTSAALRLEPAASLPLPFSCPPFSTASQNGRPLSHTGSGHVYRATDGGRGRSQH